MSYILEALKKAEHAREIGQVPRIDSEHEPAATRSSSRWITLVALVLLINAGLLLALFWPEDPASVPEPVASNPPVVAAVPVETDAGRPALKVTAAPSPRVLTPPSQPIPAPEPVPEVPPVVTLPLRTENLPVWPQVPDAIFRKLSRGLRLDVHVYSERPEDRFVLINLEKYHEGEQLQEGPLLDAITPDGIVLSLQGQRFLVRAQ